MGLQEKKSWRQKKTEVQICLSGLAIECPIEYLEIRFPIVCHRKSHLKQMKNDKNKLPQVTQTVDSFTGSSHQEV